MPSVAQKGKGGEGMRRRAVYAPDVGRPEKDMADGGAGAATAVVSPAVACTREFLRSSVSGPRTAVARL